MEMIELGPNAVKIVESLVPILGIGMILAFFAYIAKVFSK